MLTYTINGPDLITPPTLTTGPGGPGGGPQQAPNMTTGPGGPEGGPQRAPQPVSPPQWPPPWIEPAVRDLFAVAAQLRADVFQVAATYNMNRSVVYASTLQKVLNPSLMAGMTPGAPSAKPILKAWYTIQYLSKVYGPSSGPTLWSRFANIMAALPPM